jgi:hypothetical protein
MRLHWPWHPVPASRGCCIRYVVGLWDHKDESWIYTLQLLPSVIRFENSSSHDFHKKDYCPHQLAWSPRSLPAFLIFPMHYSQAWLEGNVSQPKTQQHLPPMGLYTFPLPLQSSGKWALPTPPQPGFLRTHLAETGLESDGVQYGNRVQQAFLWAFHQPRELVGQGKVR